METLQEKRESDTHPEAHRRVGAFAMVLPSPPIARTAVGAAPTRPQLLPVWGGVGYMLGYWYKMNILFRFPALAL